MELREINESVYYDYCEKNQIPFQNTIEMEKMKKKAGWKSYKLGLYNDNILKGIALINGRKITLGGMYFECNYGPNINFNNSLEVKYFFQEIKTFLYEKGATYFSFNPHIKLNVYDLNGNFLENKKDFFKKHNMENFKKQRVDYSDVTLQKEDNINAILKTLRKLKYQHHNLSENRNGKWNMRWFFIKNLENITKENLLNSFNSQAKRSTKKALQKDFIIREISEKELPYFKKLMEKSAQKQGFEDKSINYYNNLIDCFSDKVKFMIVELNLTNYLERIVQDMDDLHGEIKKLMLKNKTKQVADLQKKEGNLAAEKLKIEKKLEEDNEIIPLSAGVFIYNNNEMIYLFGGNDSEYQELCSSYALQYNMMQEAIANKMKEYNFYGISGKFDGSDGVLRFKQGFDGNIIELIGTFTLILRPIHYTFYKFLKGLIFLFKKK